MVVSRLVLSVISLIHLILKLCSFSKCVSKIKVVNNFEIIIIIFLKGNGINRKNSHNSLCMYVLVNYDNMTY